MTAISSVNSEAFNLLQSASEECKKLNCWLEVTRQSDCWVMKHKNPGGPYYTKLLDDNDLNTWDRSGIFNQAIREFTTDCHREISKVAQAELARIQAKLKYDPPPVIKPKRRSFL